MGMDNLGFSPSLVMSLVGLFFFVAYWSYNFIIVYHLARFGVGVLPKRLAAFFMIGSIFLFFVSVTLYSAIDKNAVRDKVVSVARNMFIFYPQ
jgi:hypothetical protein